MHDESDAVQWIWVFGSVLWYVRQKVIKMASYLLGTVQSSILFMLLLCSFWQGFPLLQTTHKHRRPSQNIPVYYQFKFPSMSIKSAHFSKVPQRLWVSYLMSQAPQRTYLQKLEVILPDSWEDGNSVYKVWVKSWFKGFVLQELVKKKNRTKTVGKGNGTEGKTEL